MAILKQTTAYNRLFNLVLASDHATPLTGATAVVNLSKAGAPFGVAAGAATSINNGVYQVALTVVDTNTVGDLAYYITSSTGDPRTFIDQVQSKIFTDLTLDLNGNVATTSNIKKGQALNGFTFIMTNSTTHGPQTGLAVTATRSLNGAAFAPCANVVSEVSNGMYSINLAGSDTNANVIMFRFTAAAADDLDILIVTQP